MKDQVSPLFKGFWVCIQAQVWELMEGPWLPVLVIQVRLLFTRSRTLSLIQLKRECMPIYNISLLGMPWPTSQCHRFLQVRLSWLLLSWLLLYHDYNKQLLFIIATMSNLSFAIKCFQLRSATWPLPLWYLIIHIACKDLSSLASLSTVISDM